MDEHEPLPTDFRSYVSASGDVLPLPTPDPSNELMIRNSLANRALGDVEYPAVETDTNSPEVPETQKLSSAEAIFMLRRGNGFYPRNNVEKNTLLGITGLSNKIKFPVILYFQEIEEHQKKSVSKDPEAALCSKVREFAGYAKQSAMDIKMAKLFERTKVERNFRDGALVSEAIPASYLEDDLTTRQALTTLARMREIDLFVEGEGEDPLESKSGIDVLVGKELTARILDLLKGVRISRLMDLNTRMMNEENDRFTYWRDRVSESKMYNENISLVSNELLTDLDKLRPTQKP